MARSGVRPGDLVVDLGAGTGALTEALARAGASVIALEAHHGRRAELVRRFADGDVRVVDADLTTWPFPRRPFRVVANPPWALAETVRSRLLRAPSMQRADLVLPRWLVRRWAASDHRIELGPSLRAESFTPPAPTGAAVAVIDPRRLNGSGSHRRNRTRRGRR